MPTYEYQCKNCGHQMEEFQSITEAPLVRCPNCQMDTLARIIGGGGGLIFKGSGFYLTDYKNKSNSPSESKPIKKEEKKSESPTPATKQETKPPSATNPPPKKD